jgi:predicted dehydrogenase
MGRTHEAAFDLASARGVECTTRVITLGEIDEVDAVVICTPTDSHIGIATAALEAGKHVLVEKPVSLHADEIAELDALARSAGCVCMPAHCMRFWPGWPFLRRIINDGKYAPLKSAHFRRMSRPPEWNKPFYSDVSRSGGALFDLHIHDVDCILWCFGKPSAFRSRGSVQHVVTDYQYGDTTVTAEAGWVDTGAPFEMVYRVELTGLTLDFRHDRDPALIITDAGKSYPVPLPSPTAYEAQALHFLQLIHGREAPVVTLRDAERVVRQLEAERDALQVP